MLNPGLASAASVKNGSIYECLSTGDAANCASELLKVAPPGITFEQVQLETHCLRVRGVTGNNVRALIATMKTFFPRVVCRASVMGGGSQQDDSSQASAIAILDKEITAAERNHDVEKAARARNLIVRIGSGSQASAPTQDRAIAILLIERPLAIPARQTAIDEIIVAIGSGSKASAYARERAIDVQSERIPPPLSPAAPKTGTYVLEGRLLSKEERTLSERAQKHQKYLNLHQVDSTVDLAALGLKPGNLKWTLDEVQWTFT